MERCNCAGEFRGLISKDDLEKLFKTFYRLAETFQMFVLQESISQTLQLI